MPLRPFRGSFRFIRVESGLSNTNKKKTMKSFTEIDSGDHNLKPVELPMDDTYLETPLDQILRRLGNPTRFSVETLCAAIQGECTFDSIKWYLQNYGESPTCKSAFLKNGWPSLYYAVEKNSSKILSLLLQSGLDPHELHKEFHLPLLAFAIIHGYREAVDTTDTMRILLAHGVDPKIIPKDMWINILETPREKPPSEWRLQGSALSPGTGQLWCKREHRVLLAKSLRLTHRYLLLSAHRLKKPNARTIQVARINEMTDLAKLPYYLIGQRPATKLVLGNIFSHVAIKREHPMVMAFAGPSGHGKTELASAIGAILSVKTTVIDCTRVTTVWGLFSTTSGWQNQEQGSQLNNFLADHNGLRSVISWMSLIKPIKKYRMHYCWLLIKVRTLILTHLLWATADIDLLCNRRIYRPTIQHSS